VWFLHYICNLVIIKYIAWNIIFLIISFSELVWFILTVYTWRDCKLRKIELTKSAVFSILQNAFLLFINAQHQLIFLSRLLIPKPPVIYPVIFVSKNWNTLFNFHTFNSKYSKVASHCLHSRSFVPPVRDEESETQRKAHAKRVRETRRSTQGVTLEDLKSAEQLVKKKQQQVRYHFLFYIFFR
jgi:hypothetical protein